LEELPPDTEAERIKLNDCDKNQLRNMSPL
jgi:hypothetical protein